MSTPIVTAFRQQVIDRFRAPVPGRGTPLDYATYLATPHQQRSGDEAAIVDQLFTTSVLSWLGFEISAGQVTYNRTRAGTILTRPDFVAHSPTGTAFIWEDKATPEEFDAQHQEQLRRYMAGQAGYAVWSNARRILAFFFDAGGRAELTANIAVDSLFGPQPLSPAEQVRSSTALELFYLLLRRDRFVAFEALAQRVACDEVTFLRDARPVVSNAAQRDFIVGSRSVLEQLRLAALARIQAALTSGRRQEQEGQLRAEWQSAATALQDSLPERVRPGVEMALAPLETRIGALHPDELLVVEQAVANVLGRPLLPSMRQPFLQWRERAARVNNAMRGLRLVEPDLERIRDAYQVWRPRQPHAKLATPEIFAEQVSYILFVRLLLTRVLEDKRLLPARIASDGGFAAWRALVAAYFGPDSGSVHAPSFMQLLSERVSRFYQHFFHQPLFDWFIPDDYLLVVTLEFLSHYSFAAISSDLLGFTYQEYIDRVARAQKGHFLTEPEVVDLMLDALEYSGVQIIGRRLLDPACGSGSFLVHAARRLRSALAQSLCGHHGVDQAELEVNLTYRRELASRFVELVATTFVGMDIDPFACYLAELNLLIQCLDDLHVLWDAGQVDAIDAFRIFNTDSLDLPEAVRDITLINSQGTFTPLLAGTSETLIDPGAPIKARAGDFRPGFAYVICNPPYVNARQEEIPINYRTIRFFNEVLAGDTNLYLLFIRLGLHYLAVNGRMAFIVPLTLLGDASARAARLLLTSPPYTPTRFIRFYTGSVLFEGVDQAVVIFRVDADGGPHPSIEISGGTTVIEARATTMAVPRSRVLQAVPPQRDWNGAWLVSPDSRAYDVWEVARTVAASTLKALWGPVFAVVQGDVNATHLNPLRSDVPMPGALPIYKGENVFRFVALPPTPSAWARLLAAASLSGPTVRAREVVHRLLHLPTPEDGFVLRQIGRLNTRGELKATWFERDATRPLGFTNELWRFVRQPQASQQQAKAVFGLVASGVICYLLNLFSTNNHVTLGELGRLPVPELSRFDGNLLSQIVDQLLRARQQLETTFGPLGATFPDTGPALHLSPDAVLTTSALPSASLQTLVLRGDLLLSGAATTRLDKAISCIPESSLAPVLGLFFAIHGKRRWNEAEQTIKLPEPSVASAWLRHYQDIEARLQHDWALFEQYTRALDEAVSDWYGFTIAQRQAITNGLPWAH